MANRDRTMTIKIAIVEDEEIASKTLKDMLIQNAREKNRDYQISIFENGIVFLSAKKLDFDIVFMDISMPGMDGLATAKKMRHANPECYLFFVTDLAQYAIKGYEVDAIDYIVKPVVYDHLKSRLDKVCRLLEEKANEPKLSIKTEEGLIALRPSSIQYVEIIDHRLYFHTDGGTHCSYGSLSEIEKNLPKSDFVRCNHCYLVNLRYVASIDKNFVTIGENKLAISRTKKKMFVDAFTEYLGKHS